MTLQKFLAKGLKLLVSSVVKYPAFRAFLPMANPGLLQAEVILVKVVAVVLLEVLPEQETQAGINSLE